MSLVHAEKIVTAIARGTVNYIAREVYNHLPALTSPLTTSRSIVLGAAAATCPSN
jgi:hypothetical protein